MDTYGYDILVQNRIVNIAFPLMVLQTALETTSKRSSRRIPDGFRCGNDLATNSFLKTKISTKNGG